MKMTKVYLSLLLCSYAYLLSSCSPNKLSSYKKSKALMDTFVTITVVADSQDTADKAIENAFDCYRKIWGSDQFFF